MLKTPGTFVRPTTVQKVPDHHCSLPTEDTDSLLSELINSGIFVDFRRKFRKHLLVSETNPESRIYFKSTSQIHDEQRKHLLRHYHMIHPFSNFIVMWETVMTLVYFLLIMVFNPLEFYFIYHTPYDIVFLKLILDFMNFINVGIIFFTGYVADEGRGIKMKPKAVVKNYLFGKHYITGLFAMDVLSSLPVTLIINLTQSYDRFPWKAVFVLKLFRVPTFITYLNKYFVRRKFWSYNLKPLQLTLYLLIVVLWCIAITFFILAFAQDDYLSISMGITIIALKLVDLTTSTVECLMLVGPDPADYESPMRRKIIDIFLIIIGYVLNMMILAQIFRIYKRKNASTNKHEKLLQEIKEFSTYKELPSDLIEKMIRYANFKYYKKILREAEIMGTLSEILRNELMLNNCQNLIERVDFFKELPPHLILQIVTRLRHEVYLKNEVIFQVGSPANAMFFVYIGIASLYSDTGRELMRCEEGKHFGEESLVTVSYKTREFTAVAKSDCELLRLSRRDLADVLRPYSDIVSRLTILAMEKEQELRQVMRRRSTPVFNKDSVTF